MSKEAKEAKGIKKEEERLKKQGQDPRGGRASYHLKHMKEDSEAVAKRSLDAKRMLDASARSKAAKKMLDDAAAKKRSTMKEEFVPISDVITLVANDQHAEATGIVNDLLSARVLDSLQAHKETIAQSLFAPSADALSEAKGTRKGYGKKNSHERRG